MIEPIISSKRVQSSTEAQIIRAAQKDPAAFEPLYKEFFPRIFRFILNRTGDREVTADLTSQVFLNALKNLSSYEPRGIPISSWLFRIASNTIAGYFREGKRTQHVVLDERARQLLAEELNTDAPSEEYSNELIKQVFECLTRDEIELIELRFFEKMSFRSIGEILNITENNAKVKLYRTLARIKTRLRP